jgi:hypothetical protein
MRAFGRVLVCVTKTRRKNAGERGWERDRDGEKGREEERERETSLVRVF